MTKALNPYGFKQENDNCRLHLGQAYLYILGLDFQSDGKNYEIEEDERFEETNNSLMLLDMKQEGGKGGS